MEGALAKPLDAADAPLSEGPNVTDGETNGARDGKRPGNGNGNGKGKVRRERLPLPAEIPEAPVKRYPEPSRAELQEKIDSQNAIITGCIEKLNATRAFLTQRSKIREEGKGEFDAARKEFAAINEQCRALFSEKKEITDKIKGLREQDLAARGGGSSAHEPAGGGKDMHEVLRGLRTVDDVDCRIRDLEYKQQTASLSMVDEKRLIAQISYLRYTGRQYIIGKDQSYKEEMSAKEERAEKRKALEEQRKQLDNKINETKARLEEQKKKTDAIRAKQDDQIQKLTDSTEEIDRDAVRQQIGDAKVQIRQIREEFNQELDKWYLNERIHIEQQKIAKRKKWEAQQAEREAKRKAWEAEQAEYPEPDPYQAEKDMCAGLIQYLQTILGETIEKPGGSILAPKSGTTLSLKSSEGSGTTREISSAGKAIGKSTRADSEFESLAFSEFMAKKSGKGKGKKGKRSMGSAAEKVTPSEEAGKLLKPQSIDLLAAFTHLEIRAPTKVCEVRPALAEVKAKKEYFDSDPPPKPAQSGNKDVRKPRGRPDSDGMANANGKTTVNGVEGGYAAFPGLSSTSDASKLMEASQISNAARPSFIDIAKGTVSASATTTSGEAPNQMTAVEAQVSSGLMSTNEEMMSSGVLAPESSVMDSGIGLQDQVATLTEG